MNKSINQIFEENLPLYLASKDSTERFGICCVLATQIRIFSNKGMLEDFLSVDRSIKISILGSENAVRMFEDCHAAFVLMMDLAQRKAKGEVTVTLTAPQGFGERV